MADALVTLRDTAPGGVVCAWSNCPSEPVATLLAPAVWERVLEAAGWTVEDCLHEHVESTGEWADHWRLVDPFRAAGHDRTWWRVRVAERPVVLVVRNLAHDHRSAVARRVIDRTAFLLATPQDYHALFPWLAASSHAGAPLFLCRTDDPGLAATRQADVAAACGALGVGPRTVATPRELAEASGPFDLLICASESTANTQHLASAAMLLAARARRAATAHVQHGIWPRADIPTACAHVRGPDPRLVRRVRRSARCSGSAPRRDGLPAIRSLCRSRARHCTDALRPVERSLRPPRARHDQSPLDPAPEAGRRRRSVGGTRRSVAPTLFTLKPHPFECGRTARGELPDNVLVVDETIMLAAGLDPGDLVEAADAVVTTPSTVALEAALAGRPCFVLDTGNPNAYHALPPQDVAALDRWLAAPTVVGTAEVFAARYHAFTALGQSWELSAAALGELARRGAAPSVPAEAASAFADAWVHHAHRLQEELRRQTAVKDEYIESLRWTLDRKDEIIGGVARATWSCGPAGPAAG